MRGSALLALAVVGIAPGSRACDGGLLAGDALAAVGRPSLRLVDAAAGARLAARDGVPLLARGDEPVGRAAPGVRVVRDDEPLAEPPAGRRFVVISDEPERALRLGARLAREGAADVAVVEGGLPAWSFAATGSETREE